MKYVFLPIRRTKTATIAKLSDMFETVPKLDRATLEKLDEGIQKTKDEANDSLAAVYNRSTTASEERTKALKKIRQVRDDTILRLENKKRDVHKKYREKMESWKNASIMKKAGKTTAKILKKTALFTTSFIAIGAWEAVKDATKGVANLVSGGDSPGQNNMEEQQQHGQ